MKLAVISIILIATIFGSVKTYPNRKVKLLRFENNHGTDKYNFGYATSDGTTRDEIGQLKNLSTGKKAMSVKGSYSFIADNGIRYTVHYIADENGYRAKQTSVIEPTIVPQINNNTVIRPPITPTQISNTTVNRRPIPVPSLGIPINVLESLLG